MFLLIMYHFWYVFAYNVPLSVHFWEIFGTCSVHFESTKFSDFLAMYLQCPKNVLKVIHYKQKCQCILNVPKCIILDALFWFILNFTGSAHCDYIIWEITDIFTYNVLLLVHFWEIASDLVCLYGGSSKSSSSRTRRCFFGTTIWASSLVHTAICS